MGTTATRCALAMALSLAATVAQTQSLKVEEKTDALTRESMVIGGPLKVCKAEGFTCASLKLGWKPTAPETIAVHVTLFELASIQRLQLRMDGEVRSFDSEHATTDTRYESNTLFGGDFSSANTFILPVGALQALATEEPAL